MLVLMTRISCYGVTEKIYPLDLSVKICLEMKRACLVHSTSFATKEERLEKHVSELQEMHETNVTMVNTRFGLE